MAVMTSIREVPRESWKALFAGQVGWMLDAMDFMLFTFALRAIQNEFALASGTMGLLFTVALVAGAVGGIFFGRLADAIGRVRALMWSMIIYAGATAGLATSSTIWHLVFWRIIVGLGMGGEWSCGSVLVAETWPAKHRAKAIGFMQSGWAIGALAAAGLSALILEPLGWRVLFLVGAFPAVVAVFIRRTVAEPEIWREERKSGNRTEPLLELFSPRLVRRTFFASLLAAAVLVAYWGLFSWLPSFLATPVEDGGAGMTLTRSAAWMIVVQIGAFLGYVSFGWFADRFGRRPAFTFFMIAASIVVPIYANAPNERVLLLIGPLVGFFGSGYFSLFGAFLAELFPTSVRGSAQGFCYNVGRLASAAAPWLIGLAADSKGLALGLTVNAMFFAVAAVVIWALPETRGTDLHETGVGS